MFLTKTLLIGIVMEISIILCHNTRKTISLEGKAKFVVVKFWMNLKIDIDFVTNRLSFTVHREGFRLKVYNQT